MTRAGVAAGGGGGRVGWGGVAVLAGGTGVGVVVVGAAVAVERGRRRAVARWARQVAGHSVIQRSLQRRSRRQTIGETEARSQCMPLPLRRASTTSLPYLVAAGVLMTTLLAVGALWGRERWRNA